MTPVDRDELLIKKIQSAFRHDIIETTVFRGEVTHLIQMSALRSICTFLKTDPEIKMNFISDVVGVDYNTETPRFEVVYHFYSTSKKLRIRLKVKVNDGETVPSIAGIWHGADWPEREVYDMFGIVFEGHPNLKRIYLPEDFEGFPLRKEYPVRGYKDRYNPYGVEKE
ncbi:MAG: NADH-quinone oxidoreductase subunit C [Deltaproteobacteria bacterium]|nr:NADH-quinone oxidoreductase subunit C [Deltaproteobacteria bacterium]